MTLSVLYPGSLEQLAEVEGSGMEWLVKTPEEEGQKTPKNYMTGSASLMLINKALPKPLIQSSALLNCDNGLWHDLLCASSSDAVHSSAV